jgi:arginine deiminase
MSDVWSCNEWDQLEEVIVGNPLQARFPTADRSTQLAEFPNHPLAGEVIYSPPMENMGRHDADYLSRSIGSKWIDMNLFSINPNLVVVDEDQTALIRLLEKQGLDVIRLKLRHSIMMGGGYHCVTLDVRRTGTLQRYFD